MNRVTPRVVLVSGFSLLTCVVAEVNEYSFSLEQYSFVWLVCILFGGILCMCCGGEVRVCMSMCVNVHVCTCVCECMYVCVWM